MDDKLIGGSEIWTGDTLTLSDILPHEAVEAEVSQYGCENVYKCCHARSRALDAVLLEVQ